MRLLCYKSNNQRKETINVFCGDQSTKRTHRRGATCEEHGLPRGFVLQQLGVFVLQQDSLQRQVRMMELRRWEKCERGAFRSRNPGPESSETY